MEKGNEPTASTSKSSHKTRKASLCSVCRRDINKGACKCLGQSRWRKKKVAAVEPVGESSVPQHLPNGRSLLKHTKTKLSNVPDAGRLRPSSQTKSKECSVGGETKLLLNDIRIGKECLKYDKEAVTVGVDSNFGSEPKNIFENDFDCLDSTTLLNDKSSQTCEERRISLERTPVKGAARLDVPGAPQKKPREPPGTPADHGEYAVRQPRHSCPFCSKIFRSNGKLNSHVFSHTGERPFACKHCQKGFSSKFKLVRHLLIHSEDRKFLCTVCERRFIRNDHLKNHYKVHDPRKVVFRCERAGCEKEYSSALSQRKHEAWHRAQDGDLTCLLCGIKQETAADLLVHLRRHSGSRLLKSPADRKFRCHVCERNFLTRKDVTRHLVVHTGERDFLCQFCPQRFGRKDHLVRHIKKSHVTPAKRKVNKSILTLNKSKATKTKKLDVESKGEEVVITVKEESELYDDDDDDDNFDDVDSVNDEVDGSNDMTDGGMSVSDVLSDVEPVPTGVCADSLVPDDATDIVILPASSILEVQTPSEPGPSMELSSVPEPAQSEPTLGLFPYPETGSANFDMSASEDSLLLETGRQMKLLDAQARKGGDLFEGPSQSLMFSEPSFDEEDYKSGDLMLNQPDQSSGELLRYLLQADADAPLPGFSQIFNSCPSSSS